MYKLKTIIFFCSFFLLINCQAQQNPNTYIDSSKIPKSLALSLVFGNKFIDSIRPNLIRYESSSLEYKKFQKNTIAGKLVLLSSSLLGAVLSIRNLDKQKKASSIFLGFSICGGSIVAIFLSHAKRHLLKSVRNYNIEALK